MEWMPHITVAAVVKRDDKYLIVEEKINDKIVYNQPAGHLEENENLIDAVKREVMEETGGVFSPLGLVGVYHYTSQSEDRTYIRFCFHGVCHSFMDNPQLDSPIIRALWLSKHEIDSRSSMLRSQMVKHCIDDFECGITTDLNILR